MATTKPQAVESEIHYPSFREEHPSRAPFEHPLFPLFEAVWDFLAYEFDVYLGTDMYWYFEEGNPQARRAPYLMIVKDVGQAIRESFFSWRENGAVPCLILEMASRETWHEDIGEKSRQYAGLEVREYFLFDPNGDGLQPCLFGFRLNAKGQYDQIEPRSDGRLDCNELWIGLQVEGQGVRLVNRRNGEPILTRRQRILQKCKEHDEELRHGREAINHLKETTRLIEEKTEALLEARRQRERHKELEAEITRLRALLDQRNAAE